MVKEERCDEREYRITEKEFRERFPEVKGKILIFTEDSVKGDLLVVMED